ncbi:MAG: pilus assembly protein CpaC, partial [Hydrocarboniphaga effusa]|nr:pilus assembly protein CpaC [Hydrocarboniphaga effusa]
MKRVMLALCTCLSLGLAAATAQAETLDINLSNKALRGSFSGPLSAVFPR